MVYTEESWILNAIYWILIFPLLLFSQVNVSFFMYLFGKATFYLPRLAASLTEIIYHPWTNLLVIKINKATPSVLFSSSNKQNYGYMTFCEAPSERHLKSLFTRATYGLAQGRYQAWGHAQNPTYS